MGEILGMLRVGAWEVRIRERLRSWATGRGAGEKPLRVLRAGAQKARKLDLGASVNLEGRLGLVLWTRFGYAFGWDRICLLYTSPSPRD